MLARMEKIDSPPRRKDTEKTDELKRADYQTLPFLLCLISVSLCLCGYIAFACRR